MTSQQHQPAPGNEARPLTDARNVFVVHGRNEVARRAMFDFLKALDLHPLEWSEAVGATGEGSPYIGDVLDAAFSRARAIVVLFTPDDEARLKEPFRAESDPLYEVQLTGQARPNVLFEAGMALARNPDRTILVELGDLRPFSDIGGRHTVRLDGSLPKRQALAQRLEDAGCPVNLQGTDWQAAGNFDAAIPRDTISPENAQPSSGGPQPAVKPNTPSLTDDAKEILLVAARSERGAITFIRESEATERMKQMQEGRDALEYLSGNEALVMITQGQILIEPGNRRSEARWQEALKELQRKELIELILPKRQIRTTRPIFRLTHRGFQTADSLKEHE